MTKASQIPSGLAPPSRRAERPSSFVVGLSSLPYRARQFFAALAARVSDEEHAIVAATLTPGELRLFEAMPRYDRRHCLDVRATLAAAGHDDPILLRAAAIHDCGKLDDRGHPMALPWYILATLLKRSPGLYLMAARLGGPVAVYADHAWRGARMAAAAGSPPELVEALRHYHDPAPAGRAALLKWADEQH